MYSNNKSYKNGSALVGAVMLALVLAISGATYLWVIRHSGTQEDDSLRDTRGFYAAESGLQIATRILSQTGLPSGTATVIPSNARLPINGLWVDADVADLSSSSVFFASSSSNLKTKRVTARAWDASTGGNFVKRISWILRESSAFEYGYFSNGLSNNGEGELCGNVFFGDSYITAKSSHNPLNPVCNKAPCSQYYERLTISATHINTTGNHCKYNAAQVPNGLTPLYTLLQAPVEVPDSYKYMAANLRSSASASKILLSGTGTLVFNSDGSATFGATTYPSIEGLIFVADNNINVQGTVKGSATVVSGAGKNIKVSGNLTYASLSSSAATPPTPPTSISSTSTDYLGIVSDGGVILNNTSAMQISAAIVAWRDGGTGIEMTSDKKMTLTGSLLQNTSSKDFYPFVFVQDKRLLSHTPPGFPPVGKVNNLFKYEVFNWEESSVN